MIRALLFDLALLCCFAVELLIPGAGQGHALSENKVVSNDRNKSSKVVVHFDKEIGSFKNIAPGVNFWGSDVAQERFIEEVGVGLYRIKIILSEVERCEDSYANFHWEKVSEKEFESLCRNFRKARRFGGKVMVQIYGIPRWLSSVPEDNRIVSNNLPNYAKYPPTDYREWQKLVSLIVQKLIDLGLSADYYEIFGEANVGSTWYQQTIGVGREKDGKIIRKPNALGHKNREILENFCKIYEYTAKGIKFVAPKAKIGGVALIPNTAGFFWSRKLIRYVKKNNVPFDFYSWHEYGGEDRAVGLLEMKQKVKDPNKLKTEIRRKYERLLGPMGFSSDETLVYVEDAFKYVNQVDENTVKHSRLFYQEQIDRILKDEGVIRENIEVFLTEWNVFPGRDQRHDTHYCASYIVKSLIDLIDAGLNGQAFYSLSGYPQNGGKTSRKEGFFSLFSKDQENTPKPSFNAFKLFSEIKGKRVVAQSQNDVYSFASKDTEGAYLVATYFIPSKKPDYIKSKKVTFLLENVPFSSYTYKVYLIDKDHSNWYWSGNPELQVVERGRGEGSFEKTLSMPIYSVIMIVLERR